MVTQYLIQVKLFSQILVRDVDETGASDPLLFKGTGFVDSAKRVWEKICLGRVFPRAAL